MMAEELPVSHSPSNAEPGPTRWERGGREPHENQSIVPTLPRLSKSRFLAGLQCAKRLYLEIHFPELAAPPTPDRRAIMDMGTEVGEVARRLFPGGVLVEETHRQIPAALRRTEALISDPGTKAIFEGAFIWNGVLVRVDVLERMSSDQWRLIEVKATSKVKPTHLDDLAIQMTVLENIPLQVESCVLMHLNTQYAFEGKGLKLEELFSPVDMTNEVKRRQAVLQPQLETMWDVLRAPDPPVVHPDGHCHVPYECPFWGHCTRDKPSRWIFYLPGSSNIQKSLMEEGIESIDDIPDHYRLSEIQRRVKNDVEWVSPLLRARLESVTYPVHHLDFETFMPAIPMFPRTRPYRPVPFQWSNHVEYPDGTVLHHQYLCTDGRDPREEVALSVLESLGETGTICVYSEYERYLLLAMGEWLPHFRPALLKVVRRLWDLLSVIQQHYYHPEFKGSYSIKTVLPALVPELAYDDLEIQNGAVASVMYKRMAFEEPDLIERAKIAQGLQAYCQRDTWAMVELRRVLKRRAETLRAHP